MAGWLAGWLAGLSKSGRIAARSVDTGGCAEGKLLLPLWSLDATKETVRLHIVFDVGHQYLSRGLISSPAWGRQR